MFFGLEQEVGKSRKGATKPDARQVEAERKPQKNVLSLFSC